ncbi:MAG: protease modulator HflC [Pseudomonadota bacterium]
MKIFTLNVIGAILAILVVIGAMSVFIVDETEQALVLQLGNPKGEPRQPGLHFKVPLIQEVRRFDRRVLSVDPEPEQVVIASSAIIIPEPKKEIVEDVEIEGAEEIVQERPKIQNVSGEPIIVDSFARYKIVDPLQFMKTLGTVNIANQRLNNILNDATRAVLGKTSLKELLSEERTSVMTDIRARVNRKIEQDELGIQIVDVRIVRADLTNELRTSTVRRMISELQERATETRAKGEERAKEIRALANRERTVILANADRDAAMLRGDGDEESIKIYAKAFNRDKEFYGFIRSMEAYRNTLADSETRLILSPDSEFFRYFEDVR